MWHSNAYTVLTHRKIMSNSVEMETFNTFRSLTSGVTNLIRIGLLSPIRIRLVNAIQDRVGVGAGFHCNQATPDSV